MAVPTAANTNAAKKDTRLSQDVISKSNVMRRPFRTSPIRIASFHFGICHTQIKLHRTERKMHANDSDKALPVGALESGFLPNSVSNTKDPVTSDVNHTRTVLLSCSQSITAWALESVISEIGAKSIHSSDLDSSLFLTLAAFMRLPSSYATVDNPNS